MERNPASPSACAGPAEPLYCGVRKAVLAVLAALLLLGLVAFFRGPAPRPPAPAFPVREPCEGRPQDRCAAPCEYRQSCPSCDDLPRCREPGGS